MRTDTVQRILYKYFDFQHCDVGEAIDVVYILKTILIIQTI